jgi:hypothetical protein
MGRHIFPIKAIDCEIPSVLASFQVIDLTRNPEEGYRRIHDGLRRVGLDPKNIFDWDGSRPPYPGFMAFSEKDAAVYFGREDEVQKAIAILNRLKKMGGPRLVMVLGASGSGKSSLVRAGVVPRLKRDPDRWIVIDPFRPERQPFEKLALSLSGAFGRYDADRDWQSIEQTITNKDVDAGATSLRELAIDLRAASGQHEASVLVIVDQFEELLVGEHDESAGAFLKLLQAIVSGDDNPFIVVGTLRSDFLGTFQTNETTQRLAYEPILLPLMPVSDLPRVIEGPADIAGLRLEPGLTQVMVADTAGEDALPLLVFTLRELWEKYGADNVLTVDEYRNQLGGIQGSVSRAAENVYKASHISSEQEHLLRKAFLSMVSVDEEGRYVRKAARWSDLSEDMHGLLDLFVKARLLVSRSEGSDRMLDIAHDALMRNTKLQSMIN